MPSETHELSAGTKRLLWILAVGFGGWLRLEGIAESPLYGDEYHGVRVSTLALGEILRTYDGVGSHVPLPLLQHLCVGLLGPGILPHRLPALVSGLLTLALLYPIARPWVGSSAALVATWALALSPVHVYYSRFARAYAIEILLAVVLVWALGRLRAADWKGGGRVAAYVLVLALLPYVHLASAGLVAGVALAAAGLAWRDAGRPAGAVRPLAYAALGAALCAAAYAPVWQQVVQYLGKYSTETADRPEGVAGILVLLAGGPAAAWALGLGVPVALAWLARERGATAAVLGAAVCGPVALLLVRMPHGMEFAYARYLVVAVPWALTLVAWLVVRVCGPRLGVGLGLVLVISGHLAGPRSPLRIEDAPFDNTHLALAELPAFDRRFPRAPELYERLAGDPSVTTIVEAPALTSRTVLLLRSYRLTHGKRVLLGLSEAQDDDLGERRESFAPGLGGGPYVELDDVEDLRARAQVLVLHKRPTEELRAYWGWVFRGAWKTRVRASEFGMMRRLGMIFFAEGHLEALVSAQGEQLGAALGKPFYEDSDVVAWDLR